MKKPNTSLLFVVLLAIIGSVVHGQVTTITTTSSANTNTGGISSVTTSVTRTVSTSTATTGVVTSTDTISVTGTTTTDVSAAVRAQTSDALVIAVVLGLLAMMI